MSTTSDLAVESLASFHRDDLGDRALSIGVQDGYGAIMRTRPALVAISATQVVAGVAGHVIAVREHRSFNVALIGWRGRTDRVARDSWLLGTGLSAPVVMLTAQVVFTTQLALSSSPRATRILGVLGAAMSGGYLIEQEFRDALSPGGWDRHITPVAAAGFVLSVSMAFVGLQ
jgi:hypothetical protein